MENREIDQTIEQIKGEFYSSSGKNLFFKKQQKFECAAQVASQVPLELLLRRTCWVVPGKSAAYVDYPILKSYAVPELYDIITNHVIEVFNYIKKYTGTLTVYMNLDGFTVSAAERYRPIIALFCDKCLSTNALFSTILEEFRILNTPSAMEHISRLLLPLVVEEIRPKIVMVSKKDTPKQMTDLGLL